MSEKPTIAPALPQDPPTVLLKAGSVAFREVPGLRRFMILGFLATYLIFIGLGALAFTVVYRHVIRPLSAHLTSWSAGEGLWLEIVGGLLRAALWFGEFVLMMATILVALMFTLSMMGLWYEAMVARIIKHRRAEPVAAAPFGLRIWVKSLGKALLASIWLLLLAILALVAGFTPLLGPVLVVLINSYLLGREVRDPYVAVRLGQGEEARALRPGLGWTLRVGLLPAVLGLIPVIGWLALPGVVIYLVAGYAWRGEELTATT